MKIMFSAALGALIWAVKAVVELSLGSSASGGFMSNSAVSHIVFLLEIFTGAIVGSGLGSLIANTKIKAGGTIACGFFLGLIAAVLQSMVYLNPYADYGNETINYVLFETKEVWINIPAGLLTALAISTISSRNNPW